MLEKCVSERGGVHAWADTDAVGIVSSTDGDVLTGVLGCENARILPRTEVQEIIDRFAGLNPYDFGGSILRFTEENYTGSDPKNAFRQLLAFVISAKRYATYERHGDRSRSSARRPMGSDTCTLPPIPPRGGMTITNCPIGFTKPGNTSYERCSSSNPANRYGSGGPR